MQKLLRYVVIALLIAVGVVVLAVCSDGVCPTCAQPSSAAARASRPTAGIDSGCAGMRAGVGGASAVRLCDTSAHPGGASMQLPLADAQTTQVSLRI
ncbi:MAG: hypothetical protein D9V44_06930 [Actinobacteria bacterium]|nr:MAG: hypothetical protein D9V44_06930 [Actinomycetota bacterium]